MPKIDYWYRQRAIVDCSGTLEVPDAVLAKGNAAVRAYIRENEHTAEDSERTIDEYLAEITGSMGFELQEDE
jgi:hypothetical protein